MNKVVKIAYTLEEIPLAKAFVTALRRRESVVFVRVVLSDAKGEQGVGEASATEAITGEGLADIVASLQKMQPMLLHKSIEECFAILDAASIGSSAKAALDIALVSLDAKMKKQTLFEYFGTQNLKSIASAITISLDSTERMLASAHEAIQKGQSLLKVKLANDISHAIEITKALSQNFSDAVLLIDANQAWSIEESKKYIDAVKGCRISLIEQPLAAQDFRGMQELTHYSEIPILADESVFTFEDMQYFVTQNSAAMINIKLMKCGGVREAQKMFTYARERGVKCMLGSMLEGPLSINMAIHLAYANRDVITFVDLDSPMLYKELPQLPHFCYRGNKIVKL